MVWAAAFEGGLAFVALGVGWLVGRPPLETFSLDGRAIPLGLLAAVPMLALFALCLWAPIRPFSDVMSIVDRVLTPMFVGCNVIELAVLSLLAGVGEEMLFRGAIQPALAGWAGRWIAAWPNGPLAADWFAAAVVAVVFGLMHAVNSSYAALATLIGLYLGWLWMTTGNLGVPITAHAVYDFLALVYLVKIRGPRPDTL